MRIAVVGTGVIGLSWTELFLSCGHEVVAADPAPDAEERLRAALPGRARLSFTADLAEAAAEADFVQENGPERSDAKDEIFAVLDRAAPAGAVLASSSPRFMPSRIQQACARRPERMLVGHPFNLPHLDPLVEVVPGEQTSPQAVEMAMWFYQEVGNKPILVRQELPGHIANRLRAALWREASALVDRGVVTVTDIDTAISHGPGLRWALTGPLLTQYLSGLSDGPALPPAHLGPPTKECWADLGDPRLTPELVNKIVSGVADELTGTDATEPIAELDHLLRLLLAAKAEIRHLKGAR